MSAQTTTGGQNGIVGGIDTMTYAIVQRLTPEQRAKVLAETWKLELGIPVAVPGGMMVEHLCRTANGDCPMAVALGYRGAIGASRVASALNSKMIDVCVTYGRLYTEARCFMDDADTLSPSTDANAWIQEVFGS